MNIEQVKEKKANLTNSIENLINDFREETGLMVNSLSIDYIISSETGKTAKQIVEISAVLE